MGTDDQMRQYIYHKHDVLRCASDGAGNCRLRNNVYSSCPGNGTVRLWIRRLRWLQNGHDNRSLWIQTSVRHGISLIINTFTFKIVLYNLYKANFFLALFEKSVYYDGSIIVHRTFLRLYKFTHQIR